MTATLIRSSLDLVAEVRALHAELARERAIYQRANDEVQRSAHQLETLAARLHERQDTLLKAIEAEAGV